MRRTFAFLLAISVGVFPVGSAASQRPSLLSSSEVFQREALATIAVFGFWTDVHAAESASVLKNVSSSARMLLVQSPPVDALNLYSEKIQIWIGSHFLELVIPLAVLAVVIAYYSDIVHKRRQGEAILKYVTRSVLESLPETTAEGHKFVLKEVGSQDRFFLYQNASRWKLVNPLSGLIVLDFVPKNEAHGEIHAMIQESLNDQIRIISLEQARARMVARVHQMTRAQTKGLSAFSAQLALVLDRWESEDRIVQAEQALTLFQENRYRYEQGEIPIDIGVMSLINGAGITQVLSDLQAAASRKTHSSSVAVRLERAFQPHRVAIGDGIFRVHGWFEEESGTGTFQVWLEPDVLRWIPDIFEDWFLWLKAPTRLHFRLTPEQGKLVRVAITDIQGPEADRAFRAVESCLPPEISLAHEVRAQRVYSDVEILSSEEEAEFHLFKTQDDALVEYQLQELGLSQFFQLYKTGDLSRSRLFWALQLVSVHHLSVGMLLRALESFTPYDQKGEENPIHLNATHVLQMPADAPPISFLNPRRQWRFIRNIVEGSRPQLLRDPALYLALMGLFSPNEFELFISKIPKMRAWFFRIDESIRVDLKRNPQVMSGIFGLLHQIVHELMIESNRLRKWTGLPIEEGTLSAREMFENITASPLFFWRDLALAEDAKHRVGRSLLNWPMLVTEGMRSVQKLLMQYFYEHLSRKTLLGWKYQGIPPEATDALEFDHAATLKHRIYATENYGFFAGTLQVDDPVEVTVKILSNPAAVSLWQERLALFQREVRIGRAFDRLVTQRDGRTIRLGKRFYGTVDVGQDSNPAMAEERWLVGVRLANLTRDQTERYLSQERLHDVLAGIDQLLDQGLLVSDVKMMVITEQTPGREIGDIVLIPPQRTENYHWIPVEQKEVYKPMLTKAMTERFNVVRAKWGLKLVEIPAETVQPAGGPVQSAA